MSDIDEAYRSRKRRSIGSNEIPIYCEQHGNFAPEEYTLVRLGNYEDGTEDKLMGNCPVCFAKCYRKFPKGGSMQLANFKLLLTGLKQLGRVRDTREMKEGSKGIKVGHRNPRLGKYKERHGHGY